MLDGKKLTDLRVVDLRQELEKRGLEKSGVKATLVERLQKVNLCLTSKSFTNRHVHYSMQIAGNNFWSVRFALRFDQTLVKIHVFLQALEKEEDADEETAEFIPIDSADLSGDEEEDETDETSSPLTSPKRNSVGQKQAKKTSITPVLSKQTCLSFTVIFSAADKTFTYVYWIPFSCLSSEKKAVVKFEQSSSDHEAVSWKKFSMFTTYSTFVFRCRHFTQI